MICSQPLRVISELLRPQQRVRQVHEQAGRHNQTDDVVEGHELLQTLARGDVRHGEQEEREGDADVQQVQHRNLRVYQAPRLVPHHQITPSVALF